MDTQNNDTLDGIAIIGIACRFPMAKNVQEFWDNLVQGRDCIGTVSLDDARKAGVPEDVLNNPGYIRRGGRISDPEMFDAQFFGFSPKDAALMDPQQRLFLRCGWEAIESAGYDVSAIKFPVAVFGGSNLNFYLLNNVINNPGVLKNYFELQTLFSSDKDFLATRLSYKFNLTGPSMTVQTACSTSLVATHLACQSLLTYQCDMALAGGVSLQIPWWNGYVVGDADIRSPDGVCRPFDAKANGTLFGEGCGIVVLKRLQDALHDNDHIYAVIRGSAINNDGSLKAGYTAPGVDGQVDVITSALDIASVNAGDVSYVETHGTGTPLGDPVEITALTKAYRHYTDANSFCGIGSVKASIGHLDAAAGIAGLIKTALALYHKKLPQTVNFSQPNPLLELEKTPFYVVSTLTDWNVPEHSRRIAGVSSLGVGGTNAHVILEEPPRVQILPSETKYFMFPVSARSQVSLKKIAKVFTSYLPAAADAVADIAFTLQYGRQHFPYRQFVVADSAQNAIEQFARISEKDTFPKVSLNESERIVFMFSGQGSQYVTMAKDLYNDIPVFKTTFDYCCEQFVKHTNKDLRDILFADNESNSALLQQTDITQPALFTIEYSLVKYWETLGIKPSAMIGHSIGEYIAACISGVFSLDDTIAIIATRAKVMFAQPSGKMLSISKSVNDIRPMLDPTLEIALVNSPDLCVVAGTEENLQKFQCKLQEQQIECRLLHTSHAFHSELMTGAVEPFTEFVSKIKCQAPSIPFVSNVTGTWITNDDACDPAYWGKHIRNTVQFADGITTLLNDGYRVFIEIGPSNTLCTLVNRTASNWNGQKGSDNSRQILTFSSIRQPKVSMADTAFLLSSFCQLWQHGLKIDWQAVYPNENRKRIPIPTYQFDEKRHWIDPVQHVFTGMGVANVQNPQVDTSNVLNDVFQSDTTESKEPETPKVRIQSILKGIWKEVLGTEDFSVSSNFFELGGDSLLAVQMFSKMQKQLDINLTLATLFTSPSIDTLSNLILEKFPDKFKQSKKDIVVHSQIDALKYVVPIKPTGNRTPFFCVHGVGGNVLHYKNFLPFLNPDQPLYGIQCKGLDGIEEPFNSVVMMAQSYLKEIQKIQPHGPYLLGGGSMGGVIAYEIAQQFNRIGESVRMLVMMDSGCPLYFKNIHTISNNIKNKSIAHIAKKVVHGIACRVTDHSKKIRCKMYKVVKVPIPHKLRYWFIEQNNLSITEKYCPVQYSGEIVLFRALFNKENTDPHRGWKDLAHGGMSLYDFECNHYNMIEMESVARKLSMLLDAIKY